MPQPVKIARKHMIVMIELADCFPDNWVRRQFKHYHLSAKKLKRGWTLRFKEI